jgi:hypothetical protein
MALSAAPGPNVFLISAAHSQNGNLTPRHPYNLAILQEFDANHACFSRKDFVSGQDCSAGARLSGQSFAPAFAAERGFRLHDRHSDLAGLAPLVKSRLPPLQSMDPRSELHGSIRRWVRRVALVGLQAAASGAKPQS